MVTASYISDRENNFFIKLDPSHFACFAYLIQPQNFLLRYLTLLANDVEGFLPLSLLEELRLTMDLHEGATREG